jgi:NitT/TauT family transport system substrate-binding protein
MRMTRIVLILSILLVLVAGCRQAPGAGGSGKTTPLKIAMGFIPNVQFTPMYVALERGYFAEEGLEVTLDYGMETDLLQRLGTNDLQFAIGSGDQVVLARGNGLPVRYVVNWYNRFPVCVVSLTEAGINTPQDLVGKTVGIPVTEGASYIGWLAFLKQVGIRPEQVNLQAIGYTQVASLTEKRVDAAVCYALNEPVQLRTLGYDINAFYLDEYTGLVSNGIITNDETIKKQPKLVEGVTRAFLRGLRDTLDDPDAAFAITRKAIPEMDDATATLQRAVLQECLAYWQGDPLGASEPANWEESVAFMREMGLLSATLKAEDAYTNQFIK